MTPLLDVVLQRDHRPKTSIRIQAPIAEKPVALPPAGGLAMLQKLTEEIADCYAPASECRECAKQALDDPATKRDFLEMERRWIMLARSYLKR
jgi:hypothetical protein